MIYQISPNRSEYYRYFKICVPFDSVHAWCTPHFFISLETHWTIQFTLLLLIYFLSRFLRNLGAKSTCNFPKIAFFENFQKHLKISLKAITQFAIPEKFVTSYSNVTDSREHNNCYPFFHSRSWCLSIFIFSSAWNIIFDPIIYSLLEKKMSTLLPFIFL